MEGDTKVIQNEAGPLITGMSGLGLLEVNEKGQAGPQIGKVEGGPSEVVGRPKRPPERPNRPPRPPRCP